MPQSASGGVSALGGAVCSGRVSASGGCPLQEVSASGEGVSAPGEGVCSWAGCLLPGGVYAQGCLLRGGTVSQHALRQTLPLLTE